MQRPFELNDRRADDVKRLQSALGIAAKKITLDRENETAAIQGSGANPYEVTLEECTCMDFSMRQLPCKHMIRLAVELGADFALPKYDRAAARGLNMEELIGPLHEKWTAGLITTDAYAACLTALEKSAGKTKK